MKKIFVIGGNGFVGTAICRKAVDMGLDVVSISRRGRPSSQESWTEKVKWM